MAKTQEEILATGLVAMGFEELPKTGRYRVFNKMGYFPSTAQGREQKLFVGKAGALRIGVSGSDSRSLMNSKFINKVRAAAATFGLSDEEKQDLIKQLKGE